MDFVCVFALYGSIKWFQQVNDYHWPLTCVMSHFFLHCHFLRKTDYISLLANKMRDSREIIISHVQHQIHMLQAFGWRLKLFANQNAKTINVLNTFGSWLISLPPHQTFGSLWFLTRSLGKNPAMIGWLRTASMRFMWQPSRAMPSWWRCS